MSSRYSRSCSNSEGSMRHDVPKKDCRTSFSRIPRFQLGIRAVMLVVAKIMLDFIPESNDQGRMFNQPPHKSSHLDMFIHDLLMSPNSFSGHALSNGISGLNMLMRRFGPLNFESPFQSPTSMVWLCFINCLILIPTV